MKLLIITQTVDKNDSVLGFFHSWIEEFAKTCEQVTVICLKKGEYDLPENVNVLSLGKEEGVSKLQYILNFYKYVWSERKNYDNVFVHMNPEYVMLGTPIWRMLKKKTALWYTHGTVATKLRLATFLSDIIFTASKKSFRIKSRKVRVVGHGIDLEKFPYRERSISGTPKLITVGRISKTKRQDLAVDVLIELHKKSVDVELTIVGVPLTDEDKKYELDLKDKIRKNNLEEYVKWVGSVSNSELHKYLNEADIFIHTSETGSLDKVVLEAMASGVLVVTTSDAVRSILPEKYALDKECKKDVVSISKCIQEILNTDVAVLEKLGRSFVKSNHTLHELIGRIIGIMEK